MLNMLKKESTLTYTENGAVTNSTSLSECLDLFFKAGAMRRADRERIMDAVLKAYCEDSEKTMKIIFFARDARGGLGERRFFRIAMETLAVFDPEAVKRNIPFIAEYGRYDDLCALIDTPCEKEAAQEIERVLKADLEAMEKGEPVSLLAKWMPSANATSRSTAALGKRLCRMLGMKEKEYRHMLSDLRAYIDIIENRLRVSDYTFDYSKQPSKAMFKYRKAFIRNDGERYSQFINNVLEGTEKLNASVLYPYEIVHKAIECGFNGASFSDTERKSLDASWRSLSEHGNGEENCRAIAVVDGSGSMYGGCGTGTCPADVALSLGMYFAEHNKGAFANHFITFSENPQLVEVKGRDIVEKTAYCSSFNEVANTDIEAVFKLILTTAINNKLPESEMPERLYIISDMEFDYCITGGNDRLMFDAMKWLYSQHGYKLPQVIFWNVESRQNNIPVSFSATGAALVSGFSPVIFDMVKSGDEISPVIIMESIIGSKRYEKVG